MQWHDEHVALMRFLYQLHATVGGTSGITARLSSRSTAGIICDTQHSPHVSSQTIQHSEGNPSQQAHLAKHSSDDRTPDSPTSLRAWSAARCGRCWQGGLRPLAPSGEPGMCQPLLQHSAAPAQQSSSSSKGAYICRPKQTNACSIGVASGSLAVRLTITIGAVRLTSVACTGAQLVCTGARLVCMGAAAAGSPKLATIAANEAMSYEHHAGETQLLDMWRPTNTNTDAMHSGQHTCAISRSCLCFGRAAHSLKKAVFDAFIRRLPPASAIRAKIPPSWCQ